MSDIHLERLGGFGGFGGPRSAIRSTGDLSSEQLSPAERERLKSLFASGTVTEQEMRDGFRYRITWETSSGSRTIEVPEALVPSALKNAVKDQLR